VGPTANLGTVAETKKIPCMGKVRNECKILVGKAEGKRSLERPRHT